MKCILHRLIAMFLFFSFSLGVLAQHPVYQHVSRSGVYDFLDEMANLQIIEISSIAKPYTRGFIAKQLDFVLQKENLLNERQRKELRFFLKDYNKEIIGYKKEFEKRWDLWYYHDSIFTFSVNPIAGNLLLASDNSFHGYQGFDLFAYFGKKKSWGAYVAFRENYEKTVLTDVEYLNNRSGMVGRLNSNGSLEYSEVRGGVVYGWSWGTVGLVQDHIAWGNNYHESNIFSTKTPPIPQFKLQIKPTKWFEFDYLHGWLNSTIVDSSRSYFHSNGYRKVLRPKYLTANYFIFRPIPKLELAVGNSTVYSDIDVHPSYFIPIFFYRSIDHSLGGFNNDFGQNGQLFAEVSSRNLKKVHIFASIMIDEARLSTAFGAKEERRNQVSWKVGGRASSLLDGNVSFTAEYTRNNPLVYRHFLETTTFDHAGFTLGNYLGENAHELYLAASYKPIRNLEIMASYNFIEKGKEYDYDGGGAGGGTTGRPFLEEVVFERKDISVNAVYEWKNDIRMSIGYMVSTVKDDEKKYLPEFFYNNKNHIDIGLGWGF